MAQLVARCLAKALLAASLTMSCEGFVSTLPHAASIARVSNPHAGTQKPQLSMNHAEISFRHSAILREPTPSTEHSWDQSIAHQTQIRQASPQIKSWVGKFQQRMWTKMDLLHFHAISGALSLALGIPFALLRGFIVTQQPQALVALQSSNFCMAFATLMVANIWSGLRMNTSKAPGRQQNMQQMACLVLPNIWGMLWYSGAYPLMAHCMNPAFSALSIAAICYNSAGLLTSFPKLVKTLPFFRSAQARGDDVTETAAEMVMWNQVQAAFYLLLTPMFLPIGFGGATWLSKVLQHFPLQHAVLFDIGFDTALVTSFAAFVGSLYSRRLVSLSLVKLMMSVGALLPFAHACWNCFFMGAMATLNPSLYCFL